MTIDLSKAKSGDKVKFRCGGEAVVTRSEPSERISNGWFLTFDGSTENGKTYRRDGTPDRSINIEHPCPFDIVEIVPKPFYWADAKPGMAFCTPWKTGALGRSRTVVYYLDDCVDGKRVAAWSKTEYLDKSELERCPENDRAIKKS